MINSRNQLKKVVYTILVITTFLAVLCFVTYPFFNTRLIVNSQDKDLKMIISGETYTSPASIKLADGDYSAVFYSLNHKHEEKIIHINSYGKTKLQVELPELKSAIEKATIFNGEIGYQITSRYNDYEEVEYIVQYADETAKEAAVKYLLSLRVNQDTDVITFIEAGG